MFFRSETVGDSFVYLNNMIFEINFPKANTKGILFLIPLILIDYIIRGNERLNFKASQNLELLVSIVLISTVIYFYNQSSGFIYFQF